MKKRGGCGTVPHSKLRPEGKRTIAQEKFNSEQRDLKREGRDPVKLSRVKGEATMM